MSKSSASNSSRNPAASRLHFSVLLVIFFGVAFSFSIFFVLRSWQSKDVEDAFRVAADERAWAVKGAFQTELAMLDMLRCAVMADGRIERDEFREVLTPFLSRTDDIRAVEWVPRVPESRRAEFEAAAQRAGMKDYQIYEQNAQGQYAPAGKRDEYFPIFYVGPEDKDHPVFGYDVGSEKTRLEALLEARDTGDTVLSSRFMFVREPASSGGFFACFPVYERGKPTNTIQDRRENLQGFILGVFRPSDMIESALKVFQPQGIEVGMYDPSDEGNAQTYYYHTSRMKDHTAETAETERRFEARTLRHVLKLDAGGHPWSIVCAATPAFVAAHRSSLPLCVLVSGLIFTAMAAGYLMSSLSHTAQLEDKVFEQTADIRATQEEVLFRLASASQFCDEETPMHLRRIGLMSQVLAGAVDWFGDDIDAIKQAAPMHDIGKIGIPDDILRKTEELTPQETDILKSHTRIGAEILFGSNVPMLKMAHEIALNHHEQWDGQGYPRGLAGEKIPECARIVAICDAYDTLTHDGVNRKALPEKDVLTQMQAQAEERFDPQLLAAFFRHLPEMRRIAEQYPDTGRRPQIRTGRPATPPVSMPTDGVPPTHSLT